MAALPVNVTGPFDARTSEPAIGVRVEFSPAGAALEPVTALAQIIAGAPDMRVAAVSVAIWIIVSAACAAAVGQLLGSRWHVNWRTITSALAAMGGGLFALAIYGMFTILVHIPNWRGIATDRDIVLAELHTHTFGSFDGLVSARDCLQWHHQRGCDVVAVIGHFTPTGSLEAAALAESDKSLPPVLPGVEMKLENLGRIIAFASREQLQQHAFDSSQRPFIPWFHQTYQGVVIATEERLKAGKPQEFADGGIDGFEAASDGHPTLSPALQREVLATAALHHLPVVASTDWHGIGGILQTWTAIRVPGAAALSREQRAAAVLDALRRHDYSNIMPLTVGRMGQVSLARAISAPFAESIRYALGLSPVRLLAWWVWAIVLFLGATGLLHVGICPAQLILSAAMVVMGTLVLIKGIQLIIAHVSGLAPSSLPVRVGIISLALGITALFSGVIGACRAVVRRHVRCLAISSQPS
jgi:hypothetical protein